MTFQSEKQKTLIRKDKSRIGKIDEKIKPLLNKINNKKQFYTTSSCSGRIVLIKASDKKENNLFLWVSHKKTNLKELKNQLDKTKNYKGLVYFKQEPVILHIACNSLEDAQTLVDKAKFLGYKQSSIIASKKRIIIELRSTEKIEIPITNRGKILVNDEFLKILVKESNKKLKRTWGKIKKLEKKI